MDNSIKAMLHVHGALLAALCATSPNPVALLQAFEFHLAQAGDGLSSNSEVKALMGVWATTYRQHIPASVEPNQTG